MKLGLGEEKCIITRHRNKDFLTSIIILFFDIYTIGFVKAFEKFLK